MSLIESTFSEVRIKKFQATHLQESFLQAKVKKLQ